MHYVCLLQVIDFDDIQSCTDITAILNLCFRFCSLEIEEIHIVLFVILSLCFRLCSLEIEEIRIVLFVIHIQMIYCFSQTFSVLPEQTIASVVIALHCT